MSVRLGDLGQEHAQFSVWIGFMSRTTTFTLRTASVFASSSPIPDDPVDNPEFQGIDRFTELTSSDEHDLLTPIQRFGCKEETSLISVQCREPFQ